MPDAKPILLPTPRSITLTGQTTRAPAWLAGAAEDVWRQACGHAPSQWEAGRIVLDSTDGTLPHDGYRVTIRPDASGEAEVVLSSRRRAGLRAAAATLRQIVRQIDPRTAELPCLEVTDAPVFATRGVMLDVSRDKIPTMAQFRRTIDLLAELKFNHLQLYTEHTFAYPGHEEVWREWSPITPAEARELDAYCAARGIELAANQNCFGHLRSWLGHPNYQHLAEIEGDNPWYFHQWVRRGPFSLCPIEPRAESFVRNLLAQLLPCFASPLVNIGCDETFDVGWGRSRDEVARRAGGAGAGEKALSSARARLYFEFVQKIARACAEHGRRPMMWADIALTHPEMLDLLPREMIGLAWNYEPGAKFEKWVGLLRDAGHEAWVCPGTSSWRTFTGRTTERRGNISDAAEQGARAGATGFLVCDWGDMGHRQQWPVSLAGLAQAAEAAWNPADARSFDPRATALHVLGEPAPELGVWLDELGDCDLPIRQAADVKNASALFNDLHPPVPAELKPGERAVKADLPLWEQARERLQSLEACRPAVEHTQMRQELGHATACALFAADHAIAMRDPATLARTRGRLVERAEAIKAEHERLWLLRNRPGGLASASRHYDRVIADLRSHT